MTDIINSDCSCLVDGHPLVFSGWQEGTPIWKCSLCGEEHYIYQSDPCSTGFGWPCKPCKEEA